MNPSLHIVERVHLREVLEEQKLGSSELADADTRLRLGKILGARYMIFGTYIRSGETVRVDIRLIEVETSLAKFTQAIDTDLSEIRSAMTDVSGQIAAVLGASGTSEPVRGGLPLWERYDQGLRYIDAGQYEEALEFFENLLREYPSFRPAERQIGVILEEMARQ